ncbi:hypothetical protein RJT34_12163 [Clitoria ternatea]|uniref:Uncharacterized protein n=1 Tax=Clitoria ternatea TaxID=43366 RepID=A0AAN9JLD8_CLITE
MAMRESPNPKACRSSPKRSPINYLRFLKPGALAKLRDSKITARHASRSSQISLSQLLLSPTSPFSPTQQGQLPLNEEDGIPCFAPIINLNRTRCLHRKKLFAVTPVFTHIDTYRF